ncbi:MAG: urease accessory protein UreD [Candidatus Competibacteraceae bacterium]
MPPSIRAPTRCSPPRPPANFTAARVRSPTTPTSDRRHRGGAGMVAAGKHRLPGRSDTDLDRIDLQGDARFLGWEILCLGRPAAGERFEFGECRQNFRIVARRRTALPGTGPLYWWRAGACRSLGTARPASQRHPARRRVAAGSGCRFARRPGAVGWRGQGIRQSVGRRAGVSLSGSIGDHGPPASDPGMGLAQTGAIGPSALPLRFWIT